MRDEEAESVGGDCCPWPLLVLSCWFLTLQRATAQFSSCTMQLEMQLGRRAASEKVSTTASMLPLGRPKLQRLSRFPAERRVSSSTRTGKEILLVAEMTEFTDVALFLQQSLKNSLHTALPALLHLHSDSFHFFSLLLSFTDRIQRQIFRIRFRFHFFPFLVSELNAGTEAQAHQKQN